MLLELADHHDHDHATSSLMAPLEESQELLKKLTMQSPSYVLAFFSLLISMQFFTSVRCVSSVDN